MTWPVFDDVLIAMLFENQVLLILIINDWKPTVIDILPTGAVGIGVFALKGDTFWAQNWQDDFISPKNWNIFVVFNFYTLNKIFNFGGAV